MGLSLTHRPVGRYMTIRLAGDLDMATGDVFRDAVVALIESGHRHVIADLDGLDFLDSTGLGALAGAMKRLRDHSGSFAVVCNNPRTLNVLRISGIDKALPAHPGLDQIIDVDDTDG